jgi:ribosome-associated translation inhibitor RaiA
MRITYTGRQVELAPAQLRKVHAQLAKLGKLLDGRDQSEAHVILSVERLHCAEINVNYHNHSWSAWEMRTFYGHSCGDSETGKAGHQSSCQVAR